MALDEDTQRVLWHTPTEYNPLKHSPYLPSLPSKQASELVTAAYYDTGSPMQGILAMLQAVALLHQTHHWSTRGSSFYADHLLFERLYNESHEFIDQLAEKMIGSGVPSISALQQVRLMSSLLAYVGEASTAEAMVKSSLKAEEACLAGLAKLIEVLESQGSLTPGVSNLLEGIADKHESFVYLLKQRAQSDYSYDRG